MDRQWRVEERQCKGSEQSRKGGGHAVEGRGKAVNGPGWINSASTMTEPVQRCHLQPCSPVVSALLRCSGTPL